MYLRIVLFSVASGDDDDGGGDDSGGIDDDDGDDVDKEWGEEHLRKVLFSVWSAKTAL